MWVKQKAAHNSRNATAIPSRNEEPVISRNAATVNSPGRKPRVGMRTKHRSPNGAMVGRKRIVAPLGLHLPMRLETRGLRPWLLTSDPLGLIRVLI
jgi:hypothetical protein